MKIGKVLDDIDSCCLEYEFSQTTLPYTLKLPLVEMLVPNFRG